MSKSELVLISVLFVICVIAVAIKLSGFSLLDWALNLAIEPDWVQQ